MVVGVAAAPPYAVVQREGQGHALSHGAGGVVCGGVVASMVVVVVVAERLSITRFVVVGSGQELQDVRYL